VEEVVEIFGGRRWWRLTVRGQVIDEEIDERKKVG